VTDSRRIPLEGLAMVGNGQLAALVSAEGDVVWCCWPRPDGDPVFCTLMNQRDGTPMRGTFGIELVDGNHHTIQYRRNTAVAQSISYDAHGNGVRILTCCPRYRRNGRMYRPAVLIRRIEPIAGRPTIRIRIRPAADYGARAMEPHFGSHHVRFTDSTLALRVTTDGPISYLAEERPFVLDGPINLMLTDDETLTGAVHEVAIDALDATERYWTDWVRGLAIPFEWQEATIRAAITLKLSTYEDTGAVFAAPTTSIPEAANTGRNWDYRYCWLRDAYFTVLALNRLGATRTMESFLRYLESLVVREGKGALLQPVYGLTGESRLDERIVESLDGYGGMGPVRVGNLAYQQRQHDVYGSIILASTQSFFDDRLEHPGDVALYQRLEILGEQAAPLYDQPDAGIWEFRGFAHRHTLSAAMCWAACDRLARIGQRLGQNERAAYWRERADTLRAEILKRSWSETLGSLSASFDAEVIDASLLLLPELGLLGWKDPRFLSTLKAVETQLKTGDFLLRYGHVDDFGETHNAFTVCSFWWANALAGAGRIEDARKLFQKLLDARNPAGLLSEDLDPHTGTLWGNFPQTYSMVGIITTAMRLSRRWEDEV
jgi:hypothetical protein